MAVLDLHSEIAEWPADDQTGRIMHLLNGVVKLIHTPNAYVIHLQRASPAADADQGQILLTDDWQVRDDVAMTGLDEWQRRLWRKTFLLDEQYRSHPLHTATIGRSQRHTTHLRREVIDDQAWYRTPFVAEVLEALRYDDSLISILPVSKQLNVCLGATRPWGDIPFTNRERSILHLLQAQLAWLYRSDEQTRRPRSTVERVRKQLSPRLLETHDLLLSAKSEKQISAELGVSARTAHKYIERVYRTVGVQSRAELMARWLAVDSEHGKRTV